jgi:hypothetical protein
MNHLSAPVFGGISMAEAARNLAINARLGEDRVREAEIEVAKNHFARGLLDVEGLEAHVEHVLTS